jgi:hypothetical protein
MRLEHEKLYNMFKSTDSSNWELAWQILLGWTPNEMKDFFMWLWVVVKEDLLKAYKENDVEAIKSYDATALSFNLHLSPKLPTVLIKYKKVIEGWYLNIALKETSVEGLTYILPYDSWGKISKETIAETINGITP